MTSLDLTAIILTFNEEKHIARCIQSLKGIATDIVVVDSFSSDRTHEIATDLGARVYSNPWKNHATQFQWGLDNCSIETAWIMRIDADEIAEPNLCEMLWARLPSLPETITGLYVRRKYIFMGKWIRFGGMYPIHVLRIWRRGAGRIEQRWMDEHVILSHGETLPLPADITDNNLNPIGWWIDKHNGYATKEMIEFLNLQYHFMPHDGDLMFQKGGTNVKIKRKIKESIYARMPLFVRPVSYFIFRYFIRLGFLDGAVGFGFHFMHSFWYRTLVDLKVLEARRQLQGKGTPNAVKETLAASTGLNL